MDQAARLVVAETCPPPFRELPCDLAVVGLPVHAGSLLLGLLWICRQHPVPSAPGEKAIGGTHRRFGNLCARERVPGAPSAGGAQGGTNAPDAPCARRAQCARCAIRSKCNCADGGAQQTFEHPPAKLNASFPAARRRPRPPNSNVRAIARGFCFFFPGGPRAEFRAPLNIEIRGSGGRQNLRLVSRSVDGGDDDDDDDGLRALAARPRATGYRAGRAPDGGLRAESIKTRGARCQAKPGTARDAGFRAAPSKARDDAFEPKPAKRATRAFKQSPAKRATWTLRPKPASLPDGGIRSEPRPRGRRHVAPRRKRARPLF